MCVYYTWCCFCHRRDTVVEGPIARLVSLVGVFLSCVLPVASYSLNRCVAVGDVLGAAVSVDSVPLLHWSGVG